MAIARGPDLADSDPHSGLRLIPDEARAEWTWYASEPLSSIHRSAARPVEIGARAFDLLLVLVENPGRLVTKATLLERVWPRLVVDENNLPAQIAALRRVLGPGAIRTVPGFGYRLELEVRSGADTGSPATEEPGAAALQPLPRRGWPHRLAPLV